MSLYFRFLVLIFKLPKFHREFFAYGQIFSIYYCLICSLARSVAFNSFEFSCTVRLALLNLKSLIVRPAVCRVLAPLKRDLKHRYWAGITSRTHPFGLATSYVFNKQSDHPRNCNLSTLHEDRYSFLRTYGTNLPNSLN